MSLWFWVCGGRGWDHSDSDGLEALAVWAAMDSYEGEDPFSVGCAIGTWVNDAAEFSVIGDEEVGALFVHTELIASGAFSGPGTGG